MIGRFLEYGRKEVLGIYPISNAREEEVKRNRFLIRPKELMRGERISESYKVGRRWLLSLTPGLRRRARSLFDCMGEVANDCLYELCFHYVSVARKYRAKSALAISFQAKLVGFHAERRHRHLSD